MLIRCSTAAYDIRSCGFGFPTNPGLMEGRVEPLGVARNSSFLRINPFINLQLENPSPHTLMERGGLRANADRLHACIDERAEP
jgi:hypothetical protein